MTQHAPDDTPETPTDVAPTPPANPSPLLIELIQWAEEEMSQGDAPDSGSI